MKVQSDNQPQLTEKLQGGILINFHTEKKEITDPLSKEVKKFYEYDQVKVSANPSKGEIIEAIIGYKYSIGAELATINNKEDKPEQYNEYQNFRKEVKSIANEILKEI